MPLPRIAEYDDVTLGGVPSIIVCQVYVDRVVLFVTQLPTFGTLVEARSDHHLDGSETANVRVLLGDSEADIPSLCARVVLECMRSGGVSAPLLLGLGLRPECTNTEVVKELLAVLKERKPWGEGVGAEGASSL